MKPKKPKPDVSLLDQLSAPLRHFVTDFKTHGPNTLDRLRERNAEKYIELSIKLITLISTLRTESGLDFKSAKSMEEIGLKLLKSVGMPDAAITDSPVREAIEENNQFIATLEAIRDKHEHTDGEIH